MTSLQDALKYSPIELSFGTSGLRGPVEDMSDLECYINTRGFIRFLETEGAIMPRSAIYLGGDLRPSTPRIMASIHQAIIDAGYKTENLGFLPTPAVMNYSLLKQCPSIMVTGSHIPADRNGIKFNTPTGEVLKNDEAGIKATVATVRQQLYASDATSSLFDPSGRLKQPPSLPRINNDAAILFIKRYASIFSPQLLQGKHIVVYQHSSVGRDLLVEMLEKLGARVSPVGRSETFIPIDTENVTPDDQKYFQKLATMHPDAFAIISADGDADRPFVIDETGAFHRGDVLGVIVAEWLDADFVAIPISASDAVEQFMAERSVELKYTKIGSPYVIAAMNTAIEQGKRRVVGWEVNGGFLLGASIAIAGNPLTALPTRDTFLPILGALAAAVEQNSTVSALFDRLPKRPTSSGIIDNFSTTVSGNIISHFASNNAKTHRALEKFFPTEAGFGNIVSLNTLDGLRITFDTGDIAHLRPSGNAPQLRIYSVANSQARADEMVQIAIREPDGIFRSLEKLFI